MMGCIELSHFGIYRPPLSECLSLSLFISASWTIQNDLTSEQHQQQQQQQLRLILLENQRRRKKIESEKEERKKNGSMEKNVCEFRNQLSSAFGACVYVCVCAEKFYGDACLSAKAKRVKVLCITLMRLRRFLFFFLFSFTFRILSFRRPFSLSIANSLCSCKPVFISVRNVYGNEWATTSSR